MNQTKEKPVTAANVCPVCKGEIRVLAETKDRTGYECKGDCRRQWVEDKRPVVRIERTNPTKQKCPACGGNIKVKATGSNRICFECDGTCGRQFVEDRWGVQ